MTDQPISRLRRKQLTEPGETRYMAASGKGEFTDEERRIARAARGQESAAREAVATAPLAEDFYRRRHLRRLGWIAGGVWVLAGFTIIGFIYGMLAALGLVDSQFIILGVR